MFLGSQRNKNKRHAKEIRASYLAFGIVSTFLVLNLPRIVASSIEVYHSNVILNCIEHNTRYVPTMNYYKLDFFARFFMVVNSAINFLIYCAVSTSFQVCLLNNQALSNKLSLI